jgi:uncharacterized RDD family membrane protein YckC
MNDERDDTPQAGSEKLPKPAIATPDFSAPPSQSPSPIEEISPPRNSPNPPVELAPPSSMAPLAPRLIATVIDFVIVIVVSMVFWILPGALKNLGSLVGMAYILLRDALPFLEGQSIGKKLMKIRAVTADGQSLSGNWSPALIRNAVFFIPCFGIVELIVLITREGKPEAGRRLGDDWAKTKVILDPT